MFPKGPSFRKLDIPGNLDTEKFNNLVDKEYKVFIVKAIIAILVIISGFIFIWLGIESDSSIRFLYKGATIELNKVYPGVTLSLIGVLLMVFSRLNIKVK